MSGAESMRVTALVDTYNCGHFIEEAIESVLAQGLAEEEREILVVDDGSTDDTAERVRKYGSKIRYLRKENGGQASALNYGIERARGEMVALLDGDDYWLPGKLQRVVAEFERRPDAGMVYHNFYYQHDGSADRHLSRELCAVSGFLPEDRKSLLTYDLYPTATLAFRRNVLERLMPIPASLVVQADAHLSACSVFVAPIAYVDEPLTVYRLHSGNQWNWAGNTPGGGRVFRGGAADRARLQRRVVATRDIGIGVQQWLEKNGFDTNRPELRAYVAQWRYASRAAEFALSPPGRWAFFRHLLEHPRYFRARMTWRHLIVHGLETAGSLGVGYREFSRLGEWRVALKRSLRALFGRS